MKVLILFCGGTLIMESGKDGSLKIPNKKQAIQNLLNIEPRLNELADLDIEFIDNVDSTNISTKHWDKITKVIKKNYKKYDGFVITHGTDTMAYTASALSFSCGNLGKPVVLTGSQIPGSEIETDSRRNLINAIRVAKLNISGVLVVFDEEIILGCRSSKVSKSKLDAFESINRQQVGEIRIDLKIDNHNCKKRHKKDPVFKTGFETNFATIVITPDIPNRVFKNIIMSGIKGLILKGYGPGDIPNKYLKMIKLANKKKIPILVTTQSLEGPTEMSAYEVGRQALDLGVIESYDMSFESTVTKFMWVLKRAKKYNKIKKMIYTDYAGEISPKRDSDIHRHVI